MLHELKQRISDREDVNGIKVATLMNVAGRAACVETDHLVTDSENIKPSYLEENQVGLVMILLYLKQYLGAVKGLIMMERICQVKK